MNLLVNKYLKDINHSRIIEKYNDLFESHPNYPSLLAISESLNVLKKKTISANVPFQHFDKLPNSFLTKLNHINEFVLLRKANNKFYIESEKSKSEIILVNDIKQNWNGFVFIIEENENDEKNLALYFPNSWTLYGLVILTLFLIKQNIHFEQSFYLFTTIIGFYVSYEVLKTYFQKDIVESKFCSVNKEVSCNSVINSKTFKLNKHIEFADLPILFFSISLFGILFNLFPYKYIGFLSILSFPVVLYSIYLQKNVIKKWCSLCLMISAVLIFNSIIFLVFIDLKFTLTEILNLIIASLLITPIWFLLKNRIQNNLETTIKNNKLLRFKRSEKVFAAVTEDVNSLEKIDFITIGNIHAKNNLTLFIKPSCSFCHVAIKDALQLIEINKDSIYIRIGYNLNINNTDNQYIKIAKIITHLFNNKQDYLQALKDWHIEKLGLDLWLKKWDSIDDFIFENEILEKQLNWCSEQNYNFAPVRILNKKLIPEEYNINELHYFFKE